jgi:hypothetical protein
MTQKDVVVVSCYASYAIEMHPCSQHCLLQWVGPAVRACGSEAAFSSRKGGRKGVFYLIFLLACAFLYSTILILNCLGIALPRIMCDIVNV